MANLTSSGRVPRFYVTGLRPDTGYVVSVTAVNAKGSSDALMVRAYTRKSDGLRQLIETSESALATNVANSHRGKGFVDSVWFLGTLAMQALSVLKSDLGYQYNDLKFQFFSNEIATVISLLEKHFSE